MTDSVPRSRPLRVLYVLNYPAQGGPATSLATLLRQVDPKALEPVVYSPGETASALFRNHGIKVVNGPVATFTHFAYFTYGGRDWLFFARELLQLPGHLCRLAFVLARGSYDLVHLNEGNLVFSAALAWLFGVPVVCHLRSALPPGGLRTRLVRLWYRGLCRLVIAIDSAVLRTVADLPNARVLNNPVAVDLFADARPGGLRARLTLRHDQVLVAMLGRADPEEGLQDILGAAELLRARGDDTVRFVWIGAQGAPSLFTDSFGMRLARWLGLRTGQYGNVARDFVRSMDLEERVWFLPFEPEVWSVYADADIVVTGGRAGLGRQALEAAAARKPVVGISSESESDLVVEGTTGHLVPPGRPDLLADRIQLLAGDADRRLRYGAAALDRVRSLADAPVVARQLLELYSEILRP